MEWRIWGRSTPVTDQEAWDEAVERFGEELARHGAGGPIVAGRIGTLDAVFLVEAEQLRDAADLGLMIYADAMAGFDAAPTAIEITPADEEPAQVVGATDAAKILGVSRQRFYELGETLEAFPAPIGELSRGRVWDRREIVAFGETWDRKVGRPKARA